MTDGSLTKRKFVVGFSRLRAAGCVAIIVLHTVFTAVSLNEQDISFLESTVSRMVTNNLMWVVPCFVMVTGALLLDPAKRIDFGDIFGRYLRRVLSALILCTVVFTVFDAFMNHEELTADYALEALKSMLNGTGWSHLWYLYLLAGIYLLLPFYRIIAANAGKGELRYLLAAYFVFLSALPMLRNVSGLGYGFYIHVSTVYPFYLFLGYAVFKGIVKISRKASLAILVCSVLIICAETYARYAYGLEVIDKINGYSSVPVVLQSAAVFRLFCGDDAESSGADNPRRFVFGMTVLKSVDSCSFGIYLLHMIFVRLLIRYMSISPYSGSPVSDILSFMLIFAGIFLVSWIVTAILRKIPVIKDAL